MCIFNETAIVNYGSFYIIVKLLINTQRIYQRIDNIFKFFFKTIALRVIIWYNSPK